MTFVEACRAFKAVTGDAAARHHHADRGRGGVRLEESVRLRDATMPTSSKRDLALVCDTGMWDAADAVDHHVAARPRLRGGQDQRRRPRSAFRPVRRRARSNPIRVLAEIIVGDARRRTARITIPGFYDGVKELPRGHQSELGRARADAGEVPRPGRPERFRPAKRAGLLIEQVSSRPTCDVNGIIGGYTGEGAKTVIPGEATAKVSFRPGRRRRSRRKSARRSATSSARGCRPIARSSSCGRDQARPRSRSTGTCRSSPRRAPR